MNVVVRSASSLGLTLIPEIPEAAIDAASLQSVNADGAAVERGDGARLSQLLMDVGGGA